MNGGTNNLHNSVLSPSLVDDMKALSLGATTNGPTPVVQNVSQCKLLSFQLKCSSNIDSIHYLGLTNSFDQVPRDIHTLPVKEPIPSI